MRPESWFDELTKSFADGFFADAVILALAKAGRSGRVDAADQPVMAEVVSFLENVLKGYGWIDNPRMNEETATNASFFQQAVRATVPVGTTGSFLQQIEQLKTTADALAGTRAAEPKRLSELRKFFVNHSTMEMERTESLFGNRVGVETAAWMTARG
jgi:hypothetical protein